MRELHTHFRDNWSDKTSSAFRCFFTFQFDDIQLEEEKNERWAIKNARFTARYRVVNTCDDRRHNSPGSSAGRFDGGRRGRHGRRFRRSEEIDVRAFAVDGHELLVRFGRCNHRHFSFADARRRQFVVG